MASNRDKYDNSRLSRFGLTSTNRSKMVVFELEEENEQLKSRVHGLAVSLATVTDEHAANTQLTRKLGTFIRTRKCDLTGM